MKPSSAYFLKIPPQQWRWVHRFDSAPAGEMKHARHEQWMKKNQHQHGHREIMVPIGSDHFYGVRDRIFSAPLGSFFLFDRNEPHDNGYSRYHLNYWDLWFHFSSRQQVAMNEILCRGSRILNVDRDTGMQAFRRRLIIAGPFVEAVTESWDQYSQSSGEGTSFDQLKAAITALFLYAEKTFTKASHFQEAPEEQKQVVEHVKKHIHEHLVDDLSLKALAGIAGYSSTYFHRLFHQHSGIRLHDYVKRLRLDQAKKLLAQGKTVQSVADELRFGTAAYFSRFFKNETGRPPAQWGKAKK